MTLTYKIGDTLAATVDQVLPDNSKVSAGDTATIKTGPHDDSTFHVQFDKDPSMSVYLTADQISVGFGIIYSF